MRVGFIGLGSQGAGMAEMIARAGHELVVWARRPGVVEPYVALGASVAASPANLARECDVVATCVMADKDVIELAEERGVLAAMRPGAVFVNHATIAPDTARRLGKRAAPFGVDVVDAPVSGSSQAALAKSLLVLASGADMAIDRAMPMFEAYGRVFRCGALGNAQIAKLINNGVFYANMAIARRALRLAAGFGVSPDQMRALLAAGSGASFAANVEPAMFAPSNAAHIGGLVAKDSALLNSLTQDDADARAILGVVADTLGLVRQAGAAG